MTHSFLPLSRLLLLAGGLALLAAPAYAQEGETRSQVVGRPPDKEEEFSVGRYVFAGVGIDSYQHDEVWKQLDNAVNDVTAVRQMLMEDFDFDSPDEWLLLDDEATNMEIRGLVDDLRNNLQPDDNLVFFFAGHGATVPNMVAGEVVDSTAYIVPVGVKTHAHLAPSQYLEIEDLLEALARLPARHVLVIFDSCYSGMALQGTFKTRGGSEIIVPDELIRRRSRHVISSAMGDQLAFDDNDRYPGNSLFTGWLLEGLRRATEGGTADEQSPDTNEDGSVTVSELATFVSQRVSTVSDAQQTPDHGTFELDGRGELVITLDTDPFNDLYRLAEEFYLEFKIEQFNEVVTEALEFEDAGPRPSYLRYLRASLDGDPGAELAALRELSAFAAEGVDIPMDRGPLMVSLRRAEAACKGGRCETGGG